MILAEKVLECVLAGAHGCCVDLSRRTGKERPAVDQGERTQRVLHIAAQELTELGEVELVTFAANDAEADRAGDHRGFDRGKSWVQKH